MEDFFTEFLPISFWVSSNSVYVLGVNFSIAISMGLLGGIIFSVFPTTTASLASLAILKKFIIYFLLFSTLGYTSTVFIDTKPSEAEVNKYLLFYIERNCGYPLGTFP